MEMKLIFGPIEGKVDNPFYEWHKYKILTFRNTNYENSYNYEQRKDTKIKVLKWYKKDNNSFKVNDEIVKIKCEFTIAYSKKKEKIVFYSTLDGTLKKVLVNSGKFIKVGEPIAIIDIDEPTSNNSFFYSSHSSELLLEQLKNK